MSKEALLSIKNEAIDSAQKEVASIRKVLAIQTAENERYRDHVQLLGAEIDGLRKVVAKKQEEVNKNKRIILKRDDTIQVLNQTLVDLKVERGAIKEFSDQNNMLLDKFEKQRKEKEKADWQLGKLNDETRDLKTLARTKAAELMDSEAGLITDLHKTNQKLLDAMERRRVAELECTTFKERSVFLSTQLKSSEDRRSEQIERSRQSEYRTLQRTEELLEEMRQVELQNDQLDKTVQLANFRGDSLQERLTQALDRIDHSEDVAIRAVDKAEDVGGKARLRERLLMREMSALRLELDKSQGTVKELYGRMRAAEAAYKDQSKTVEKLERVVSKPQYAPGYKPPAGMGKKTKSTPKTPNDQLVSRPMPSSEQSSLMLSNVAGEGSVAVGGGEPVSAARSLTAVDLRPAEDGRQRLLLTYVEAFVGIITTNAHTMRGLEAQDSLMLAGCGLQDDDLVKILDRLRHVSLVHVHALDLRGNSITDVGADYITTWLLALKGSDFARAKGGKGTLLIDLRDNNVHAASARDAVKRIRHANRREIRLCDVLDQGGSSVLALYGPVAGGETGLDEQTQALIKVDFGSRQGQPLLLRGATADVGQAVSRAVNEDVYSVPGSAGHGLPAKLAERFGSKPSRQATPTPPMGASVSTPYTNVGLAATIANLPPLSDDELSESIISDMVPRNKIMRATVTR